MGNPDQTSYGAWQHTLREVYLLRAELTQKSLLYKAQGVFEHGNKNGKSLAWLAKGQFPAIHISGIRDADGELLRLPACINDRFFQYYKTLYSIYHID